MHLQAEDRADDAARAVTDADKTHKRAKDLDSEVEKLRKKIQGEGNHHCLLQSFFFFLKLFATFVVTERNL